MVTIQNEDLALLLGGGIAAAGAYLGNNDLLAAGIAIAAGGKALIPTSSTTVPAKTV